MERIKTNFPKLFLILLTVFFICGLGFGLRRKSYSIIPPPGLSLDEYANAWSGLGLIQLGVPVGWSYIRTPAYQPAYSYINVDNVYQTGTAFGNPFYLHAPWLDHPPGMGLLTGGYTFLKGGRVLEDTAVFFVRKPMIFLGVLNIFLLFLLARLYFNYHTALIASIIYAVSPLTVVSSRLPQAENAYLSFFLLSTIFIRLYQLQPKVVYFLLSAVSAGVGVWFKIPAVMITVSGLILILASYRLPLLARIKLALTFGFMSLSLGLLPLLAYGLALDPASFFQVIMFHSQRTYGIGVSALFNLLTQSKLTNSVTLTDGWIFFGWLSWLILFTTVHTKNQKSVLFIPVLVILVFYIFLGSEPYGWYAFTFLPWLAMAVAALFQKAAAGGPVLSVIALLVTIPSQILITKLNLVQDYPALTNLWRWGFAAYLFLVLVSAVSANKFASVTRNFAYLWLFLGLILSAYYSWSLTPAVWAGIS